MNYKAQERGIFLKKSEEKKQERAEFCKIVFQAAEEGRVNESGGDGDRGGHSRPNGPPAGHSVIHKMRPFSQTTLYRLLSCHSCMQLGRESSVPSAFR